MIDMGGLEAGAGAWLKFLDSEVAYRAIKDVEGTLSRDLQRTPPTHVERPLVLGELALYRKSLPLNRNRFPTLNLQPGAVRHFNRMNVVAVVHGQSNASVSMLCHVLILKFSGIKGQRLFLGHIKTTKNGVISHPVKVRLFDGVTVRLKQQSYAVAL